MCLSKLFNTKEQARRCRPKTAKEDIEVWKILTRSNKSIIYSFQYKRGIHYYQTGRKFGRTIIECSRFSILEIDKGLHSYLEKPLIKLQFGRKYVKFIIPKGSKYYQSGNKVVSDQLIYP